MRQKIEMPIGQKVRGYGILNEFGEFDFIPEQKGIRKGEVKLIKEDNGFTISETKNLIIVHQRLPRKKGLELIAEFLKNQNLVLQILRDYDI